MPLMSDEKRGDSVASQKKKKKIKPCTCAAARLGNPSERQRLTNPHHKTIKAAVNECSNLISVDLILREA